MADAPPTERITLRTNDGEAIEVTLPVADRHTLRRIEFGTINYDGRTYRVWRHITNARWWGRA